MPYQVGVCFPGRAEKSGANQPALYPRSVCRITTAFHGLRCHLPRSPLVISDLQGASRDEGPIDSVGLESYKVAIFFLIRDIWLRVSGTCAVSFLGSADPDLYLLICPLRYMSFARGSLAVLVDEGAPRCAVIKAVTKLL